MFAECLQFEQRKAGWRIVELGSLQIELRRGQFCIWSIRKQDKQDNKTSKQGKQGVAHKASSCKEQNSAGKTRQPNPGRIPNQLVDLG